MRSTLRSLDKAFVVYQGHHGDAGAHRPTSFCRARLHRKERNLREYRGPRAAWPWQACSRRGMRAKTGRSIRALSEVLGQTLALCTDLARPCRVDGSAAHLRSVGKCRQAWECLATAGYGLRWPFGPVANFYMTDPISRASETMAKCTPEFVTAKRAERDGHRWLSSWTYTRGRRS